MPRIDLNVPFSEKGTVKALGAKWDPDQKVWYVPDGLDPKPFTPWCNPSDAAPSVRASGYYIAEAVRDCWKCKKDSRVYAFILPSGFEALYVADDPQNDAWEPHDQPSTLRYITQLPQHAQQAMRSLTPTYFKDVSRTTQTKYWVNHCEHCQALLGDFETLETISGPFSPGTPEQAQKITLRFFNEPFASDGGYTDYDASMELWKFMRKI